MRIYFSDKIFIEQSTNYPFLWDLYTVAQGKRRKDQMVDVETLRASGLNFEHIVRHIADYGLEDDKVRTIKEYIDSYKEIQEKAINKIKEFLKNNKNYAI